MYKLPLLIKEFNITFGGNVMSRNLKIDSISIEERSQALKNASEIFSHFPTISPIDERSTIVANINAQLAYSESEEAHAKFSVALANSADIIETIAYRFLETDSQKANMFRDNN